MRDDTSIEPDAHDEGALLAAYLDGETDELTTARIERRLTTDDALAARLDAIAATRARLQRLDEVVVPADVRARLHERLDVERTADEGADRRHVQAQRTRDGVEDPGVTTEIRRGRRWSARAAPVLATAAAIVVIAVLGTAAVLGQLGLGGSDESAGGVSLDAQAESQAGVPQAAAPGGDAADRGAEDGGGAMTAERAASEAARGGDPGGTRGDRQAAVEVDGDADIAARAERLRDNPPSDLAARERRLRERAGLSTSRLCVRELRATTVDLVDEGGRVSLAVLVRGTSPQIVLLDPRTCVAIRTIPAPR